MKAPFPWAVLKDAFEFLISRDGIWLALMSLCLIIVFAVSSLIIKIFIFGPATYVLSDAGIFLSIAWPLLYVLYGALLCAMALVIGFVLLLCLHQHFNQKELLFGFEVLGEEKKRLVLLIQSFIFTIKSVVFGLIKGDIKGLKAPFDSALIYVVSIFEYTDLMSAESVLKKSAQMMEGHLWEMVSFTLVGVLCFLTVHFLIWNVFVQLLLWVILLSYGITIYVFYYQSLKK